MRPMEMWMRQMESDDGPRWTTLSTVPDRWFSLPPDHFRELDQLLKFHTVP